MPLISSGTFLGGKIRDYLYWKIAYDLIKQGEHLNIEGVNKIIAIKHKIA